MTNRDKINNMSNEEFVEWCGKMLCNKINCKHLEADYSCKVYIECDAHEKFLKWLSQKAELTADEMFEESGYIKENEKPFVRYHKMSGVEERIFINGDYSYSKTNDINTIPCITEAEDKAIHKKIEELKVCKD